MCPRTSDDTVAGSCGSAFQYASLITDGSQPVGTDDAATADSAVTPDSARTKNAIFIDKGIVPKTAQGHKVTSHRLRKIFFAINTQ